MATGWGLRQSSGSAWTSKLDLCRSQCHAERPKVWSMWSSNAMQRFVLAWPLSICDFFVAFWQKNAFCFPTYSQVVLCVQRLSLHSIHHWHKNINSNMWKRKIDTNRLVMHMKHHMVAILLNASSVNISTFGYHTDALARYEPLWKDQTLPFCWTLFQAHSQSGVLVFWDATVWLLLVRFSRRRPGWRIGAETAPTQTSSWAVKGLQLFEHFATPVLQCEMDEV